ncbi:hypothetical protein GEMRC1_004154 [Eukaryota sp. GEM-RC1]
MGFKFAVVCSSNQNRSMSAHLVLQSRNLDVRSFGTGTHVRLPGPSLDTPNVYPFSMTYSAMFEDLKNKDEHLYSSNGVLQMLKRNADLKPHPERFQEATHDFDVVFTFEQRVFDQVLDFYLYSETPSMKLVHVINLEVPDTHADAEAGAHRCGVLADMLNRCNLGNDIFSVIKAIEDRFTGLRVLYTPAFS